MTSNKNLKKLQIQQNRTLKILFNKDIRTPTKQLHKQLNILMIKDLRNLCLTQIAHKHFYGNNFSHTSVQFQKIYQLHSHNTRQSNNFHVPKYKTKSGQHTIEYTATKLWNALPVHIQNLQKYHLFKKHTKKHYITTY